MSQPQENAAKGKYRLITRSDMDGLICAVILKELELIDEIGSERDALNWLIENAGVDENIKIKDLSNENELKELFSLSFLKKKINYLNQNFYKGIFAIWMPGI